METYKLLGRKLSLSQMKSGLRVNVAYRIELEKWERSEIGISIKTGDPRLTLCVSGGQYILLILGSSGPKGKSLYFIT